METLLGDNLFRLFFLEKNNNMIYLRNGALSTTGSIKDVVAKYMIEDAKERKVLRPGMTIVEPTSGNTGIALASYAKIEGYRFIAIVPSTASKERL